MMKYLTRSYVEALGLLIQPVVPIPRVAYVGEEAAKPQFDRGVMHDGTLYVDEGDGLCFRRVDRA